MTLTKIKKRRPSRKTSVFVLLFASMLFIYLCRCVMGDWIIGSDGLGYYAHLRSLIIDHDLHYENEFTDFTPFNHSTPNYDIRSETGHVPNKYPIGCSLLWAPFFLVAHGAANAANMLGAALPLNGYSMIYEVFIGLGTLFYGGLGIILIYRMLRMFFDRDVALFSIPVFIFSSNVLHYLVNEPSMSHGASMFIVALFAYIWIKNYGGKTISSYFPLGLASGMMIMVRPQNGLFMILPLLEMIDVARRDRFAPARLSIQLKHGLFYLLTILFTMIPQFIVWKILYGRFIVYSYTGEGFNFFEPKLIQTLFSSKHGLISWTPIILFCVLGLLLFMKNERKIGSFLLTALILQWILNASWCNWWFGAAYGGRAFMNCTFIFIMGLAAFLQRIDFQAKRPFILAASMGLVAWNLLFMGQYILGLTPLEDYLSWPTVLKNQGVVIRKGFEELIRRW